MRERWVVQGEVADLRVYARKAAGGPRFTRYLRYARVMDEHEAKRQAVRFKKEYNFKVIRYERALMEDVLAGS